MSRKSQKASEASDSEVEARWDFRQIVYGSDTYREACALRDAILRAPLGLSLFDEDLSAEAGQLHFGLFAADGTLAACVTAVPLAADHAKIRQMAVRADCRGLGLGRLLLTAVECHLAGLGIRRITLHARLDALGFYQKLGYTAVGEIFTEVGIPHVAATRIISPAGG